MSNRPPGRFSSQNPALGRCLAHSVDGMRSTLAQARACGPVTRSAGAATTADTKCNAGAVTAALPCSETVGVPQHGNPHGCGARNDGGDCIGFRRQQESLPFLQHAMPAIPSVAAKATSGTACAVRKANNNHAPIVRRRTDTKNRPAFVIPLRLLSVSPLHPGVKPVL